MDLGSVAVRQEVTSAGTCGSAPTSPKTMAGAMATTSSGSPMQAVQTHPLNLASGLQRPSHHNVELLRSASSGSINSRSLPNIPSAMGRPGAGGLGSKVRQHLNNYFRIHACLSLRTYVRPSVCKSQFQSFDKMPLMKDAWHELEWKICSLGHLQ